MLKNNISLFLPVADLANRSLEEIEDDIEKFVASIYNGSPTTKTCNDLRYKLFARKGSQNEALPPTKDALLQHLKRAEHQTKIWLSSLEPIPRIQDPDGHGWKKGDDGILRPVLMTMDPMPKAIAEMVKCSCKASQCKGRCSCKAAELPCTNACPCEGEDECQNIFKNEEIPTLNFSSDEDQTQRMMFNL